MQPGLSCPQETALLVAADVALPSLSGRFACSRVVLRYS